MPFCSSFTVTAVLNMHIEPRNLFTERACCRRQSHFIYIGQGEEMGGKVFHSSPYQALPELTAVTQKMSHMLRSVFLNPGCIPRPWLNSLSSNKAKLLSSVELNQNWETLVLMYNIMYDYSIKCKQFGNTIIDPLSFCSSVVIQIS